MKFFSTNHKAAIVDFKIATIKGQAPDKGLYFPQKIPMLSEKFIQNIESYSNEAIAYEVIKPYISSTIHVTKLKQIVEQTINFSIPLVPINKDIFSLELFNGPTFAFKDIGARFMSRCLAFFLKNEEKKITVLVATSGDTGGAVANGFYDIPNVDVIILYPSGKVSAVQEKQMTTLGKNITVLEINGSFDDCQQMVKDVFSNSRDFKNLFLTSANSINIARWLPQQFYYFFAYKQWAYKENPPVIAVPSGNFGNICAGILAHASGLPVKHFIAACNANDTVPHFFETDNYEPKKSVPTISNAMDVGNPSNFVRILQIFNQETEDLKKLVSAQSISDADTKATLKKVYKKFNYLLDPHGAVGYHALQKYLQQHPAQKGIVVETAHPIKFFDVVEPIIKIPVPVPQIIEEQLKLPKNTVLMENNTEALRDYLLKL